MIWKDAAVVPNVAERNPDIPYYKSGTEIDPCVKSERIEAWPTLSKRMDFSPQGQTRLMPTNYYSFRQSHYRRIVRSSGYIKENPRIKIG